MVGKEALKLIKNVLLSDSQQEYAGLCWDGLKSKTLETFKGAFYVALIFGLFSIPTDGYLEKVFHAGIIEHIAKITLPLSFLGGLFFAGLAALCRRKNKKLFLVMRSIGSSFLIFSIGLFTIVSGLCFGLACASLFVDGWRWLLIWSLISGLFYMFALLCHLQNISNYTYYSKSKEKYVRLQGYFLVAVSLVGIFFALEQSASDLVGVV